MATSSYGLCTNSGVERVSHTMALILAMVGDEQQTDWDVQLARQERVQKLCQRSHRTCPQRIARGTSPPSPPYVFGLPNIGGNESLNRNQPTCIDLATARQQRDYRVVRELQAIYVSRLDRRNAPRMDALRLFPPFSVNG